MKVNNKLLKEYLINLWNVKLSKLPDDKKTNIYDSLVFAYNCDLLEQVNAEIKIEDKEEE